MSSVLRSLARGVATHNMKQAGVHHPHENIKNLEGISWFGANWKEWVKRDVKKAKARRTKTK